MRQEMKALAKQPSQKVESPNFTSLQANNWTLSTLLTNIFWIRNLKDPNQDNKRGSQIRKKVWVL
jgi:hypothetical protein